MEFNYSQINNGLKIYLRLPEHTCSNNVVIRSIYGTKGVAYAKSLGGIFTLRLSHTDKHFGNPYSSIESVVAKNRFLVPVESTKDSVVMYITWILYGKDSRCVWIRSLLDSGEIKNKPLIYYKELDEPSHANALDYLINNWDSLNL